MFATDRVLGVDPGSQKTGFGLVVRDRSRLFCVDAGVIKPRGSHLGAKLQTLRKELREIIDRHRPTSVAVEDLFHHRNARSMQVLAQVRGVILLTLAESGFEASSYAPAMVKRVVTGSGRAEKAQIAQTVSALLGMNENLPADAFDALGVAVCHLLAGRARLVVRTGT